MSSDGDRLFSASDDWTIKAWSKTSAGTWTGEGGVTFASPDAVDTIGVIGHSVSHTVVSHRDWVLSLVLSPCSRTLFSGSADRTVGVWDVGTASRRASIDTGHRAGIEALALSAEARYQFCNSYFNFDPGSSAFPLLFCSHRDDTPILGDDIHHIVLIGAPFEPRCD